MQYVLLGLVAGVFAVVLIQDRLGRRRSATLRHEVEQQGISFRMRLDRVKVMGSGWTDVKGGMALIVRADTFEVTCPTPLLRAIFAMEYYFRAAETTIEVSGSPSFIREHAWIVVTGQDGGKRTEIAMASEMHLYDAWVALVRAGTVPVGPPPVPHAKGLRG
jgi:hypothetical protein